MEVMNLKNTTILVNTFLCPSFVLDILVDLTCSQPYTFLVLVVFRTFLVYIILLSQASLDCKDILVRLIVHNLLCFGCLCTYLHTSPCFLCLPFVIWMYILHTCIISILFADDDGCIAFETSISDIFLPVNHRIYFV